MRFFGKTEEEIQDWIDENTVELNVLPENWQPIEIFRQLKMQIEVTMNGSFYKGFDRNELLAIMDIYNVKKKQKIEVLNKVSYMETITLNKLNA